MTDEASIVKTIKELEKKYGTRIRYLSDTSTEDGIEVIPTMLAPFDVAIGIGGIPMGYFTEIFSPEGVGKTTLCLQLVAQAQRMGIPCAYIDIEHRLDLGWAERLGVDLSNVYITQPPYGEAALNILRVLIEQTDVRFIVVDSVPALIPKKELEGETGDQFVGLQARMIAQHLRQVNPSLKKNKASVVFINQLRSLVGGGSLSYGPKKTTPGGLALKYYASVRIDMRTIKTIKTANGDPTGQDVQLTVVKSSLSAPKRKSVVRLTYNVGFDPQESIIDTAVSLGFIERSGAWYSYGDQRVQGRSALAELLRDKDVFEQLYQKVMGIYITDKDGADANEDKSQEVE